MKYSLSLLALLCFFSCSKNEPIEPTPSDKTGVFFFHLHTYIDLQEVDLYNIAYENSAGRTISLNMAQLYISDIQLVRSDGSLYNITGKNILKTLEEQTFQVGEVPVGNYKSVRFKVGLPPQVNAMTPEASADSLILKKPAMWFGSTPQPDGYVFLNVQGKVDTSADLSHPPVPFVYKIGTNANYVQVTMGEQNFSVEEDKATFSHIVIDYSKLFKGVTLNQAGQLSVTTVDDNNTSIAQKIVNNIPSMFIYE